MINNLVTVLLRYQVLASLDFLVDKLNYLVGIDVHHVVVVVIRRHLKNRVTRLEIMANDQICGFKLGQHPVDRRQPNVFSGIAQTLI